MFRKSSLQSKYSMLLHVTAMTAFYLEAEWKVFQTFSDILHFQINV